VHKLLQKWRHLAYAELRDPGSYFRLLTKAEQIMRIGKNPTAGSFEDVQALIRERLDGRCPTGQGRYHKQVTSISARKVRSDPSQRPRQRD
jgi:hypothetical protein